MLASFPGSSLVELERRLACFVSRNTSRNVWKCSEEVQHSRSWVMTDWPASTVTGLLYSIDAQYLAAGCFCSTLSFAYGSSRNQLLFVKLVQTVTLFACWVEFLDYITVYFMSVYTYYQSLLYFVNYQHLGSHYLSYLLRNRQLLLPVYENNGIIPLPKVLLPPSYS